MFNLAKGLGTVFWALVTLFFISVGPGQRLAEARNSRRQSDVYRLMTACHQYAVDHQGSFPGNPVLEPKDAGTSGLNLAKDLVPAYLTALPVDPLDSYNEQLTGYEVSLREDGMLVVTAMAAELGKTITMAR